MIAHSKAIVLLIARMIAVMVALYLSIVVALSWLTTAPLVTIHLSSVVGQLLCSEGHLRASKMSLLPIEQGVLVAAYLHTLVAGLTRI